MNGRVLVLDDDETRLEIFRGSLENSGYWVCCVYTADEAICKLSENAEWDIVFLDHDLGGEVFVDSDREDCGMEVVRWIEENHPVIKSIYIHSWNIPAASRMATTLLAEGYVVWLSPFGTFTMR